MKWINPSIFQILHRLKHLKALKNKKNNSKFGKSKIVHKGFLFVSVIVPVPAHNKYSNMQQHKNSTLYSARWEPK